MNPTESAAPDRRIRSFVLRSGRMSDAQRLAYDTLSPRFVIPFASTLLDCAALFGNQNPLTVEIGFGMGAATAEIAAANPGINYLGIEVHRPGVGKLLWEIDRRGLANLRIIEYDAVAVLEKMIGDGTVAAFHIFYPDPWPKKRHHKRRLIQRPLTDLLVRKLAPGGYFYMSTDWADYGEWALAVLSATPGLANRYSDFAPRQEWRPETRFEHKGLEKEHIIRELIYDRVGA